MVLVCHVAAHLFAYKVSVMPISYDNIIIALQFFERLSKLH